MASESGIIAAYVSRSLDRKKTAERNERDGLQQKNETSRPQGRQQTGQNIVRPTPTKGGLNGRVGAPFRRRQSRSLRPGLPPMNWAGRRG